MADKRALRSSRVLLLWFVCSVAVGSACSGSTKFSTAGSGSGGSAGTGGAASTSSMGSTGSSGNGGASTSSGPSTSASSASASSSGDAGCPLTCSYDLHSVVDCMNNVVEMCTAANGCDLTSATCVNACQAAVNSKLSVGCDYYATDMDQYSAGLCFAAFVANTWDTPAHIAVDFAGTALPVATFARVPSGGGPSLTLGAYDPVAGLPVGQVAVLFLAGTASSTVPCPIPATAVPTGAQILMSTGIGSSFHITTDVPVVAYEINPYGGGSAAVTGASLLLPTSVWDTNYLAVTAAPMDIYPPSMNIVAQEDNTHVTMLPTVAVAGGGTLPAGPANVQYLFTLAKGQQAQFTQPADLTGSIIQTDKPIGFMAGQPCMRIPLGVTYCDHGEQMVPPIRALGSEYVAVMHRPRVTGDEAIWHLVGVVDGTMLTYSSAVGGPVALLRGQAVDFASSTPFTVTSQDAAHPFMLFEYMSGSQWAQLSDHGGYGDPDFVINVPPQQYNEDYTFFADSTYPETNLVVVRAHDGANQLQDVTLDCAGVLTGWQPVGNYEWTRIDLSTGNFQNAGLCTTGLHEIKSTAPFGLWVWGWGTPLTTTFTANVSYGYPGGMNVRAINTVVMPPTP